MTAVQLVAGAWGSPLRALTAAGRAALAVFDQGCVALTGFLANVLLARWLPTPEYGAWAVGWSAFLLAAALHQAGFGEPQLALGGGRFARCLGGYAALLRRAHWRLTLPVAVLLLAVAALAAGNGAWRTAGVAGGLALAVPGTLYAWLCRSACYAAGRGAWAARGSAVYGAVGLGGIVALHALGRLGPGAALAALGVAGVVGGLVQRAALADLPDEAPRAAEVRGAHLGYAAWGAGTQAMNWFGANLHLLILGGGSGLVAAGAMKALDTTLAPAQQVAVALAQALTPWLAARATRGALRATVIRIAAGFAAVGALAAIGLLLVGDRVLTLLYGPAFADQHPALAIYALMLVPYGASLAFQLGCRARLRGGSLFALNVATIAALGAGYALGARHGVLGMCWAAAAAQAAVLPLAAWLFWRGDRASSSEAAA